MSEAISQVIPCGGYDNEHDDCQNMFSVRDQSAPICQRCEQHHNANSVASWLLLKVYVQCTMCGACGSGVTDPCVECLEAENVSGMPEEAPRRTRAGRRSTRRRNSRRNRHLTEDYTTIF
ncbi:hypothetical protein CPB86DRAFT_487022 [Serendipita vermifera]|nr:hypothetical protein CPB86DRAFT_487022 [Serendipita vermifera]